MTTERPSPKAMQDARTLIAAPFVGVSDDVGALVVQVMEEANERGAAGISDLLFAIVRNAGWLVKLITDNSELEPQDVMLLLAGLDEAEQTP